MRYKLEFCCNDLWGIFNIKKDDVKEFTETLSKLGIKFTREDAIDDPLRRKALTAKQAIRQVKRFTTCSA